MCCIEGCGRVVRLRGVCAAHYDRLRTGKDMSKPVRDVIRSGSDVDRLKAKTSIDSERGCWLWTASRNTNGYGQFRFRGRPFQAHRASWILHHGEIPEREPMLYVLHKCDVPLCVNPEHLFLGTQAENALDAVSKQRWGPRGMTGEAHGRAVLTEQDVVEIRASTQTQVQLAERYGVSKGAIAHIQKRRSWKHVI